MNSGLWSLALRSAWNRRLTLSLVMGSVALSTLLLLGVERLRHEVRQNFARSISGTDLVVGARTGSVQLLLHAVFHVGGATSTIHTSSLDALAANPAVDWLVPLSLGDTHRGYPVLATTADYFRRVRHGEHQALVLAQGRAFGDSPAALFEVVLGAEVARALGSGLGAQLTLSHGESLMGEAEHDDQPFTVVGVLQRTGTPVDRTLHISLRAMEAIHLDWADGHRHPPDDADHDLLLAPATGPDAWKDLDLSPRQVTAALVGLKSRAAALTVQRQVNQFAAEPLMAVLPGVALDELWALVGVGENAMLALSALVAVVSLLGLVAVVLAGLNERRRELAVLRAVGAGPRQILLLLLAEGCLVTWTGAVAGVLGTAALIGLLGPWLQSQWGLHLGWAPPTPRQWGLLGAVLLAGMAASLVPGWRAYRLSLADGLSPKV